MEEGVSNHEGEPRRSSRLARLKAWARMAKREVFALYLAARDPRVPWYAKAMAWLVAGYALSPIDLIPDFIPVLGYVDDLILLPLCILLVVRIVPAELMADLRQQAEQTLSNPTSGTAVAAGVILFWIVAASALLWILFSQ